MGGYLGRVSKALICDGPHRSQGRKAATDNIATLKKGDMADRAPEPLTRPHSGTRAKRQLWLARCAPPPCHWRGTPLGRCAADFRSPFPPSCTARATSTRQGFDTAIGMRPISSPDALMIEIQNPSRLPSYAISCARAAPRAAASSFVGNSIPSSSLRTSVANHVKSIPHVGPPIVVRPSRCGNWVKSLAAF